MHHALVYGSFSLLGLASVYFLIAMRVQYLLYSAVILLCLLQIIGAFFRILHWPGGDQLLMAGLAGTLLGGGLLVRNAFRNKVNQVLFNKLAVGILLILQIGLSFLQSPESARLGPLMNYPIAALAATVLINDQTDHRGEKFMITTFLLQSVVYIVLNVLNAF